ncbi:MAG: hypothetical protein ACOCV1_06820, partial [Bacillota bacterium]
RQNTIGGYIQRYVIYKRDWRTSFEKYFPKFCEQNPALAGVGDCINFEALKIAIKEKCLEIIFIHPDGFYCFNTLGLDKFCEEHDLYEVQKAKSKIKEKGVGYTDVNELTCVFPMKLLIKIGEYKK